MEGSRKAIVLAGACGVDMVAVVVRMASVDGWIDG